MLLAGHDRGPEHWLSRELGWPPLGHRGQAGSAPSALHPLAGQPSVSPVDGRGVSAGKWNSVGH